MADEPLPVRPEPAIPVSVEDIEIIFYDPGPIAQGQEPPETQGATYHVQLLMSDGSIDLMRGNLIPHLTDIEIAGLQSLLARLRGKAETAWIP